MDLLFSAQYLARNDQGLTGAVLVILFVLFFVGLLIAAISVALYVLRSFGLYRLAVNRGMPNPWIAWIPLAWIYLLGDIADDINYYEGIRSFYRIALPILHVLVAIRPNFMLFSIPGRYSLENFLENPDLFFYSLFSFSAGTGLFFILWIGLSVVHIMALYRLFQCYCPQNATLWAVLCVFFGFMRSVFVFAVRDNRPNWITPAYRSARWTRPDDDYGASAPPREDYLYRDTPPSDQDPHT